RRGCEGMLVDERSRVLATDPQPDRGGGGGRTRRQGPRSARWLSALLRPRPRLPGADCGGAAGGARDSALPRAVRRGRSWSRVGGGGGARREAQPSLRLLRGGERRGPQPRGGRRTSAVCAQLGGGALPGRLGLG